MSRSTLLVVVRIELACRALLFLSLYLRNIYSVFVFQHPQKGNLAVLADMLLDTIQFFAHLYRPQLQRYRWAITFSFHVSTDKSISSKHTYLPPSLIHPSPSINKSY